MCTGYINNIKLIKMMYLTDEYTDMDTIAQELFGLDYLDLTIKKRMVVLAERDYREENEL